MSRQFREFEEAEGATDPDALADLVAAADAEAADYRAWEADQAARDECPGPWPTDDEVAEYEANLKREATMAKVILRKKFGSMDKVERVFAFDPDEGSVLCLLREWGGKSYLEGLQVGDLEAIQDDKVGTFADTEDTIRQRAEYTVPSLNETK